MSGLTLETAGLVAVAAAAVAILAAGLSGLALWRIARVRRDQAVVLGDSRRDLGEHAAGLEREFRALHDYMGDVAGRLDGRVGDVESHVAGAVTHVAIHRYDAYHEMSGHQSFSVALLDDHGTGIVISSIHRRDSSRLYVREVLEGDGPIELAPEEVEAVRRAMAGEPAGAPK